MAHLVAQGFFRGLLSGAIDVIAPLCATRVNFDGRWVTGQAAIGSELARIADRARSMELKLVWVRPMAYPQMLQRFGPPPDRLRGVARGGSLFALARFEHQGAVAILRRQGRFWRVVALTD